MSHNLYMENEVLSATPEKLVILLYNGAINFLRRLTPENFSKDIEHKNYNIKKAHAIISELQMTLNHDYAEISESLFALYSYMGKELIEANMYNDFQKIENVVRMLKDLRDTWNQVIANKVEEIVTVETDNVNEATQHDAPLDIAC